MSDREHKTDRRTRDTRKGLEVVLPEKTELPLPEEPMAQVAVPATIHGTSPLDSDAGPMPPKSRMTRRVPEPEKDQQNPPRR